MGATIIIPARLESRRLPGKLLLAETGIPLIKHTVQAAQQSKWPVWVATGDAAIDDAVFPMNLQRTPGDYCNGTERAAAAVKLACIDSGIIVNWQADEPEVPAIAVDVLVDLMERMPELQMATLATDLSADDWGDPNVVKVVEHNCIVGGFGRRCRDFGAYRHVGIYAYRRGYLLELATMPPSADELREDLEQLRDTKSLIRVCIIPGIPPGINTRSDYDVFVGGVRSR